MSGTLRDLQLVELGIYKDIIGICEKHGIPYYAMAGTALGAVRHKGFIPWDDDMDIGIPRPYYEEFAKAVREEAPAYLHLEYSKIGQLYRVLDTRTKMRVETFMTGTSSTEYSPFVDFFAIDGMPSGKVLRWLHATHYLFLRMCLKFHFIQVVQTGSHRSGAENFVIRMAKALHLYRIFPADRFEKKMLRCALKYDYNSCDWCAVFGGAYRYKDIYPKAFMGKAVKTSFEDTSIPLPEKYHEYLTSLYGDYMIEIKRAPHAVDFIES